MSLDFLAQERQSLAGNVSIILLVGLFITLWIEMFLNGKLGESVIYALIQLSSNLIGVAIGMKISKQLDDNSRASQSSKTGIG
jgi:hypothetical protein